MLNNFFKFILNCFNILAFFKKKKYNKISLYLALSLNASFSNQLEFKENNNYHDLIMNFCIYYELYLK
jgi:hypothetical protein